uniref:ATP synthase subunit b, chloroplastic n=2 Tax=Erodium TaxID=21555 RepID=B7T2P5_9ROSI|nr:ATP synthase CF0 subunit I [Erodium absinthoides]YP_009131201.1 ATP synthase CF0 subunit I [Erodium absinthoides]YP_009138244.1 ATP synthase CF0 subunit I [Erodium chrysanthum]YP_009138264.1 ATP synthase CF0 subunit I [Erodium chrysanthum]ACH47687.1 ATP synthase CF0 subunit I [Erodium chrysanthum]AIA26355.1 ATP synthase CF0 subunit I [Erodium absinthoides]AIA26414.1 ATP synthase CF0 subunit I [Erodium absinthoides]AIA81377.1 ATP synthase CF0 subunit I [Erodium chrysanthum]AIA81397.1 ATP 
MQNGTDSFVFLGHWPSAGSFGFNTDLLATNPINLSVVLGVLIFFGKGVLNDLLDNRKQRIVNTIRNSEELRGGAIEELEKAHARLRKVKTDMEQFRVNEYSRAERKRADLITAAYKQLEQFENFKNESILFEQQRAINQVRQWVFQEALEGALQILNRSLNTELHLRTISANIGLFGSLKERTY